jgi:hypothetical protein
MLDGLYTRTIQYIYLTDICWDSDEACFNVRNKQEGAWHEAHRFRLYLSLCVPVHYQHAPAARKNVPAARKLWHVPRFATGRQDCQHLPRTLQETVKVLKHLTCLLDTGFPHVWYDVVNAVVVNSTIFWDKTPCSPVELYPRLIYSSFLLGLSLNPEDGGSMSLRNVSELLPGYTLLHPRKQFSSFSNLIDQYNLIVSGGYF